MEMVRVNVSAAAALLKYAADAGAGRFCLLSSGTVYEPYRSALEEEAALNPTSFLGVTKLAAELLSGPFSVNFPVSILRLFFPYGAGQKNRLVPDLIHRVRFGIPIQLSADGEGMRFSPTYVGDIGAVIRSALEEGWVGKFNVASPIEVSIRELGQAIGRIVGEEPIYEQRDGAAPRVVPELDRLWTRFEVDRFTSLDEGLRRTIHDLH
jgi:nucleoside-diphosphate-sugar epimerase